MLQHHRKIQSPVTQKQDTGKDEMNLVTINNIWLKCYLKFYEIVPAKMGGYNTLAIALNGVLLVLGKNLKNYCTFLSDIFGSLFSTLTTHANLSLSVNSIIPAISEGIVVLNDFERGFCRIILDSTSNNFIVSYLSFVINIFVNILYIFCPQSLK